MLQRKDFIKCGSPEKPFELHISEANMTELIKRDIAMDKILELRDNTDCTDPIMVITKLVEITEGLKG